MGKSTPQPPAPPDPFKTAQAQAGTNIQTAIANSYLGNPSSVTGPYGSTTSQVSGYETVTGPNGQTFQIPRFSQNTTLSPEQQALYNQQNQLGSGLNQLAIDQTGRLSSLLGSPVNSAGLPDVSNDFSADRSRVEQAMFDRLNPQLQLDRDALESTLVNQGFQRGTQGFNTAMNQFGRQANDARLAITGRGLQEQQGLFGMSQANRQRALQEMLALRNQPINEISALRSGNQVSLPQAPQFQGGNVAPTDVMGSVYNSAALANSQYQQQMQNQNAAMGGMFGLGQAGILGALKYIPWGSDRRLKRDIVDLGIRLLNGVKLYAYRYVGETKRRVGVMADELLAVRPDAVTVRNGYLAVYYDRAF